MYGWLSLAGFGNAIVMFDTEIFGPFAVPLSIVALIYGVSALAASIGLWKRREWARRAVHVWMGSCVAIMAIFVLSQPIGMILGGYLGLVAFAILVAAIFYGIDSYTAKYLNRETD